MKILIIPLLLLALVSRSFGVDLVVVLPTSLYLADSEAQILPFGHVPWGRKIIGWLVLAKPSDACGPLNFNKEPKENFIVVVQKGGCEMYVKAQNAEKAGARMLLIADNTNTGFEDVKLAPSSVGSINISVLGIKKSTGDKFIQDLNVGAKEVSEINISVDFTLVPERFTTYYVSLSSGNRESYKFLREWRPYYSILTTAHIRATYVYQNSGDKKKECLCNRYCVPSEYKNLPVSDLDAANENIRQICVYHELGEGGWWDYVLAYEQFCLDEVNVTDCSLKIRKALEHKTHEQFCIDKVNATDCSLKVKKAFENIDSCVTSSFQNNDTCNTILENKLPISGDHYFKDSAEVTEYDPRYKYLPSMSIENRIDIQNLSPTVSIFAAMCSIAYPPPDECSSGIFDTTAVNPDLQGGRPLPPEPPLNIDIGIKPEPNPREDEREGEQQGPKAGDENGPKTEEQVMSESPPPRGIGVGYFVIGVLMAFAVGFFFGRRYLKKQQQYQNLEEVNRNSIGA